MTDLTRTEELARAGHYLAAVASMRADGCATVVFTRVRWAGVEGPVRLEGPDDPAPRADDRALALTFALSPLSPAVGTTTGDLRTGHR